MGNSESAERRHRERFEEECRTVSDPILVFPGYMEAEQMFLDNEESLANEHRMMLSVIKWLIGRADMGTSSTVLTKIIDFLSNQYDIGTALLNLKIERAIATSAACFVNAQIEAVARQLRFLTSPGLNTSERSSHLVLADNECFKLLCKFNDDNFYLKKYALASVPVLVNFTALFVPIAIANYRMTSSDSKKREIESNVVQLKAVIESYEANAVQDRVKYVKCHRNYARTRASTPVIDHYYSGRGKTIYTDVFTLGCLDIADKVRDYYNTKLESLYCSYFASARNCIAEFYSTNNYN